MFTIYISVVVMSSIIVHLNTWSLVGGCKMSRYVLAEESKLQGTPVRIQKPGVVSHEFFQSFLFWV